LRALTFISIEDKSYLLGLCSGIPQTHSPRS
jgi:hypothetical protein